MYAKEHRWTEKGMMYCEIYTSDDPATMPLTTDGIDGVPDGYKLSPGSVIYVTSTSVIYILGTEDDWTEQ